MLIHRFFLVEEAFSATDCYEIFKIFFSIWHVYNFLSRSVYFSFENNYKSFIKNNAMYRHEITRYFVFIRISDVRFSLQSNYCTQYIAPRRNSTASYDVVIVLAKWSLLQYRIITIKTNCLVTFCVKKIHAVYILE